MLHTMPVFHISLKFVKLWFISVWYTPKVATGGRICWRKKCSTFVKNSSHSSFSYICNSSIIATMTLLELPCCFSLSWRFAGQASLFWTYLWFAKMTSGLNFQKYMKKWAEVCCGNWPLASSSSTRKSSKAMSRQGETL